MNIDSRKLEAIWRCLVQKYDAYRTLFLPMDDEMAPFVTGCPESGPHQGASKMERKTVCRN